MPRLTADQWETIRAEREAGCSFPELAAKHGVSHQAIQKRAKKEGWAIPPTVIAPNIVDALEVERRRIERRAERKRAEMEREKARKHKMIAKKTASFERAVKQGGHVYIVYCEHAGERWYKIGVTNNFTARLVVIQTGCPLPVFSLMSGMVCAARHVEKTLHDKFAASRVSGEWFSLSDAQLAQAVRILSDEISKSATMEMDLCHV